MESYNMNKLNLFSELERVVCGCNVLPQEYEKYQKAMEWIYRDSVAPGAQNLTDELKAIGLDEWKIQRLLHWKEQAPECLVSFIIGLAARLEEAYAWGMADNL